MTALAWHGKSARPCWLILKKLSVREVSRIVGDIGALHQLTYKSPEVVLIGLVNEDRLILPWELARREVEPAQLSNENTFSQKMLSAERSEFVDMQFADANTAYLECINEAHQPWEQAAARLARARVLDKLDLAATSREEYLKVVDISCDVVDEYGVPFCLYAARSILETDGSQKHVLSVIERLLDLQHWLTPEAGYIVTDLLGMIVESGSESDSWRKIAQACQEEVGRCLDRQRIALAVQKEFPRLILMAQWNTPDKKETSVWAPCCEDLMLIGLTPAAPGALRLAIVVRINEILGALAAKTRSLGSMLKSSQFIAGSSTGGELLGANFPGLRIISRAGSETWLHEDLRGQQSFYLVALLLVLCTTALGAYSVWRDMRREFEMAEMRSQFIASVSHELKTPLTGIRVLAETLRLGRCRDRQRESEYLDTIVNESHRLTRLLNNVLDFSKIEKGKRTYHKELVNLSEIVNSAIQAMQYPLAQEGFHLNTSLADDLPPIHADRDALEQAIINLMSNAMKYSDTWREIALKSYRTDDHAVIEVSDRGVGIPAAEHERIFERFYRVPDKENDRVPGTGLGLALAWHIAEGHGGYIKVQSEPNKGSTFSIWLPLEDSA